MNCLEFHREKLADPRRLSAEAQAHAQACASCAAFARSVDESDQRLEEALASPVPDGLADRIILRSRTKNRAWRTWALAASVVLAVAVGSSFVRGPKNAADQYARLAIEHVMMEPESLTTVRNADPPALRTIVQDFGGTLKALPGTIRYIRLCPVEDGTGWHIVFETPEGLATLLVIPGQPLGTTQHASSAEWSALARPTRRGYYAVVTRSAQKTSHVDQLIRKRIDWDA